MPASRFLCIKAVTYFMQKRGIKFLLQPQHVPVLFRYIYIPVRQVRYLNVYLDKGAAATPSLHLKQPAHNGIISLLRSDDGMIRIPRKATTQRQSA